MKTEIPSGSATHHPSNKITRENMEDVFSYHRPTADQAERHSKVKVAAQAFALEILRLAPDCADRAAALRHVREAMMTTSAAIALEPKECVTCGHAPCMCDQP